jgi:hypothetical protein
MSPDRITHEFLWRVVLPSRIVNTRAISVANPPSALAGPPAPL